MDADEEQAQRNQRSSIPSFLFVSFMLFMLTSRNGDEFLARHQYQDALTSLGEQLSNYTTWMDGGQSNFSMPHEDPTAQPLISQFLSLSGQPDPNWASYYSNISGFMHGELLPHNITPHHLHDTGYSWSHQAMAYSGETNMTELIPRLGSWNWTATKKVSFSVVEKRHTKFNAPEDTLMLHGRIELTDTARAEELRLDFEAIHFVANGSLYGFAEPTGKHIDIRLLPSLVPQEHQRLAASVVVPELKARMDKVEGLIDAVLVDQDFNAPDETTKSTCPFRFYGQVHLNGISQVEMTEFENELDHPTGITTVPTPKLSIRGVLVSKECGLLYEVLHIEGLRSRLFFRKVTTYAGIVTLTYLTLITLLSRQISRSQTPSGVSRVSRWTFLTQAIIDSVSFAAHLTFAVLADGRPSLSLVAPAFLACVLFVQEAQFAFLIHQIQLPEDNAPNPPPPNPPAQEAPASSAAGDTLPTQAPQPPPRPSFFAGLWNHIRTDPQARLWLILFFFLTFVVRVVLSPTLALLFVSTTYSCFWLPQIIRSARKGRSSGFTVEYVIGTTACRLGILLYFLACPKNVLDVEPRSWAHILAAFILLQVLVLLLQEILGPSFFIPQRYSTGPGYDYHPPMPLPDPESPDQSLGDCAICMDAILVDPTAGRSEKHEDVRSGLLQKMRRSSNVRRQTWSLAPCHHLFHTECLERWLAIKNICPHCRRPLPPL